MNAQMHVGLSGIDYFGSDIGGFHRGDISGEELDELYTVWFANSTLLDVPVRPHTENLCNCKETAPDRVGDLESNRANIRLRYALNPLPLFSRPRRLPERDRHRAATRLLFPGRFGRARVRQSQDAGAVFIGQNGDRGRPGQRAGLFTGRYLGQLPHRCLGRERRRLARWRLYPAGWPVSATALPARRVYRAPHARRRANDEPGWPPPRWLRPRRTDCPRRACA